MAEAADGCVKPAKGPMMEGEPEPSQPAPTQKKEIKMIARVGNPAPDFEASAYPVLMWMGGSRTLNFQNIKGNGWQSDFIPGTSLLSDRLNCQR